MRRTVALIGFATIVAAFTLSFVALPDGTSRADAGSATFLIPASDGYGVADCLMGGAACGKVVADAWCEAQGFSRAESFGVAAPGEVTGAVETTVASAKARPIAITCAH